jgi:hypothetical protein
MICRAQVGKYSKQCNPHEYRGGDTAKFLITIAHLLMMSDRTALCRETE